MEGMTPEQARAALTLPAVAPVVIPPLVTSDGFGGLRFAFGHKITTAINNPPTIADQQASPLKPADKAVSFSTYGVVIPISGGRRRLSGNVIESSPIQSVMLGTYDYTVDYEVPITTTDSRLGSLTYAPSQENNPALDLTETKNTTTTDRVFQNNDPTSSNWVDVQRYQTITLIDANGISRTYTFTVT